MSELGLCDCCVELAQLREELEIARMPRECEQCIELRANLAAAAEWVEELEQLDSRNEDLITALRCVLDPAELAPVLAAAVWPLIEPGGLPWGALSNAERAPLLAVLRDALPVLP